MSFLTRRPGEHRRPARVLTAAGRQIVLDRAKPYRGRRAAWQADAWAYRDSIGEIRYAMSFLRNAASRVRVMPALAAPDGSPPTPLAEVVDEQVPAAVLAAAEDALARLTGGTYQWGDLLGPQAECFEVVGECVLVGRPDPASPDLERWEMRSIDSVASTDRGWVLKDAPDARVDASAALPPDDCYVARLWVPHPQWPGQADSPMRALGALGGPCEELQLVSRAIRAAARSRFASAGILGLPSEIDFAAVEDDPENPDADPFMTHLTKTIMTAIADEGDASSVVPILLRAPAEIVDKIKYITMAFGVDSSLLDRGERALRRIAAGLDVPPEIITGLADVNHWTAWQVDASVVKNHVEPLLTRMFDAITAGYLRTVLPTYPGVPAEWASRVIAWYDTAPITEKPNRVDDAKAGHQALVLSDRALVEALGWNPDTDMPDEEELARRTALTRGAVDATLTDTLLRMLLLQNLPERPAAPTPAAIPGQTVEDEPAADGGEGDDTETQTPAPTSGLPAASPPPITLRSYRRESRRLGDIDRQLREQLAAAAASDLTWAVDRAANRVRGRAQRTASARAVVAAVEPRRSAQALGRDVVTADLGVDLAELFAGAWDALRARWDELVGASITAALDVVSTMTGAAVPGQLADRLRAGADAAWEWLLGGLTALAERALFDPDAVDGLAELGEDTGRAGVVTSLTRGALAQAGGLPGDHPGVSADGTPAAPGARLPGLATGDVVESHLRASGVETLGYEWVYGISRSYFEPHRSLDGAVFETFDSRVLAHSGWPGPRLAPGDHKGCHCDAMPVYVDGPSSLALDELARAQLDPQYRALVEQIARDDIDAGFVERYPDLTSPIRAVLETERVANSRPSQPAATPITDAVTQRRN